MTQEEKQILLKDLCARLPYGVKVQYLTGGNDKTYVCNVDQVSIKSQCVGIAEIGHTVFTWRTIDRIKPYLRPISSMTEDEMDKLFDILHIDKDGKDEDWIKINDVYGIKFFFPTGKWIENVAEIYDYLYSIHIDFRGLIHKGLAIEVTPENNPYENDARRVD